MRAVRSFLCWMLALEALICWWDVPRQMVRALAFLQTPGASAAGRAMLTTLPMMAGGVVFAMLCVAVWNRWRSARLWAMAAGGINLLFGTGVMVVGRIFPHDRMPPGLWQIDAVLLGMGALTIAAFWKCDAEAENKPAARPAKIPGDGTHPLLDKLAWVIAVAGFLAAMGWWWRWARMTGLPQHTRLGYWPEVVIAELAMVLLHESGHALTGKALGMRLRGFIVGPFQWRVREGRWAFRFRLADFLATGGSTAVVPTDPHQSRQREIWMIAAGPAASWLGGLAALAALLTAPGHAWAGAWRLLALFTTFSLSAAVVNLLPFRTRSSYSDGAQIYQLLSGGPWGDYHRLLATVGSSTVIPLRPRDFDIDAMERAAAVLKQGLRAAHLRLLEFCSYLDRGQLREASHALNEAETVALASPSEIPLEFCSDFVFGKAFVQRDPEGARAWWARLEAKKPTRFNADYWLARASSLWMEGKMTEAKEAWEKGNAAAQRLPAAGAYEAARDKFAMLRRELDAERRVLRWHDDVALTTY
ncbi:MAG: M50 family metallopeptidase [Acidobacteriaceae bacterium]